MANPWIQHHADINARNREIQARYEREQQAQQNYLHKKAQPIVNIYNQNVIAENALRTQCIEGVKAYYPSLTALAQSENSLVAQGNQLGQNIIKVAQQNSELAQQFNAQLNQNINLYNSFVELDNQIAETGRQTDELFNKCVLNLRQTEKVDEKVSQLSVNLLKCIQQEKYLETFTNVCTGTIQELRIMIDSSEEEKNKILEKQNLLLADLNKAVNAINTLFSNLLISEPSLEK